MKNVSKLLSCWISILLLISFFPAYVHGEERSFEISNVEIYARIDSEGNMHVTEFDTYVFNGAFNGVLVNLNSFRSDGVENFRAYEIKDQQENLLEVEETVTGTNHEYKVYSRSEDETKIFKFTYSFKNVVQVYSDIAELYWKFFDETNPTMLEEVRIDIELPAVAGEEQIWFFGHGTEGSINHLENGVIRYEVSPLLVGEFLEARILFPTSFVPGSTNTSAKPMLEQILAEEENWALAEESFDYSIIGALVLLIANIFAGITFVYKKYNKPYPSDFDGKYYRELPSDATPAVVSYLMKFRTEPRDMMATLMDLVRKKNVAMEIDKSSKRDQKDDYIFRWLKDKNHNRLLQHEKTLIHWFFKELGDGKKISLSDIKSYSEDTENIKQFLERWNDWKNEVKDAVLELDYVEVRENKVYRWVILAVFIQIFIIWTMLPEDWEWLFLCSLLLLLFKPKRQRRTRKGQTEYSKWKAFKNFLRDYSLLSEREPLAIYLWEHYFVYAIPLGIAKKMDAISRIDIPSESQDTSSVIDMSTYISTYNEWTSSIENTISKGQIISSSDSSSSGSFTSGGGGGGGGGGRGAF